MQMKLFFRDVEDLLDEADEGKLVSSDQIFLNVDWVRYEITFSWFQDEITCFVNWTENGESESDEATDNNLYSALFGCLDRLGLA